MKNYRLNKNIIYIYLDLPIKEVGNGIKRENIVKIVILIPIVVIKAIINVIGRVVILEEIVKVELKTEMNMVKDIRVIVEIVTVMKMKSVGDLILLYLVEVMEIEKIILVKLDRFGVIC